MTTNLKETIKEFRRNFVPKGRTLSKDELRSLKFRRTRDDELCRCTAIIGDDVQIIGHIFCGEVAEWINITNNDKYVYLCERHAPHKDQRIC